MFRSRHPPLKNKRARDSKTAYRSRQLTAPAIAGAFMHLDVPRYAEWFQYYRDNMEKLSASVLIRMRARH